MKAWYTSTTIQGQIVAAFALLVQVFKLPVTTEEVSTGVAAILAVIGIVMTIIGRVKTKGENLGWSNN